MLPDPTAPGPGRLERRTPGETDLRVFTTEVLPAGKHRPDGTRRRLRVVRDAHASRPALRLIAFVSAQAPPTTEGTTPNGRGIAE